VLLALLQRVEKRVLFLRRELGEAGALLVDGADRVAEQLSRRERQLIALARRSRLPRTAAVEPLAGAPRAAELLVDVIRHARFERARSGLVLRNQSSDRGFDERGFRRIEVHIRDPRQRLLRFCWKCGGNACSAGRLEQPPPGKIGGAIDGAIVALGHVGLLARRWRRKPPRPWNARSALATPLMEPGNVTRNRR